MADIPKSILDKIPEQWLDETFVRKDIVDRCEKIINELAIYILVNKIDYTKDDESLAELVLEYFDVEDMTENEFGYVLQMIIVHCVLFELQINGHAERTKDNKWRIFTKNGT
jgi:hypothetical protein